MAEAFRESETIHLRVASHPENLARIRCLMSEVTSKISLAGQEPGSIILAVDEACSNIIKHSCKNDDTRTIDLSVRLKSNALIISIVDDGILFGVDELKSRDLKEVKPGGLGLHIIKQVMDTVVYSCTPEGFNKIKMIKKLTP
jgi:anti-sigma regulatory factor (Ser/Thr protein kinase)